MAKQIVLHLFGRSNLRCPSIHVTIYAAYTLDIKCLLLDSIYFFQWVTLNIFYVNRKDLEQNCAVDFSLLISVLQFLMSIYEHKGLCVYILARKREPRLLCAWDYISSLLQINLQHRCAAIPPPTKPLYESLLYICIAILVNM